MAEYIERAAAVTVCDKQYRECLRKSDFCGDTVAWNICADIKAIPAADVAPEEVLPKDRADEIALKLMRLADLENICSYTRLRELAEADKDGRLVVLPEGLEVE